MFLSMFNINVSHDFLYEAKYSINVASFKFD